MKEIIKHYKTLLLSEKFVITGSYALNIMGVYPKDASDLDIILLNPPQETLDLLSRLMVDNPAKTAPYEGSKQQTFIFMHDKIKIDVFIAKDAKEVETDIQVDGVYLSKCDSIIKAKKGYNRDKDWGQLRAMSQLFFKQAEFETYLNQKYNLCKK